MAPTHHPRPHEAAPNTRTPRFHTAPYAAGPGTAPLPPISSADGRRTQGRVKGGSSPPGGGRSRPGWARRLAGCQRPGLRGRDAASPRPAPALRQPGPPPRLARLCSRRRAGVERGGGAGGEREARARGRGRRFQGVSRRPARRRRPRRLARPPPCGAPGEARARARAFAVAMAPLDVTGGALPVRLRRGDWRRRRVWRWERGCSAARAARQAQSAPAARPETPAAALPPRTGNGAPRAAGRPPRHPAPRPRGLREGRGGAERGGRRAAPSLPCPPALFLRPRRRQGGSAGRERGGGGRCGGRRGPRR